MQVVVKEPELKEWMYDLKNGQEFTTRVYGKTFTLKVIDIEEE